MAPCTLLRTLGSYVFFLRVQERNEAKKMFATPEEAAAHGAKTFEPTEDLEKAKAAAAGAAAQSQQQAQQQQPSKPKGPTPEQLVAIKAAIANAAVRLSTYRHLFINGDAARKFPCNCNSFRENASNLW